MPRTVKIENIEEGMELHAEIANKFGQTLIGAGVVLGEKHIKILKTWNIQSVVIKSDDKEEASEITEEVIALAEEFIKTRIEWTPRNKFEEELYGIALTSAALAIKKGGANATA